MIRLVQLRNGSIRRIALVDEPHLRLLTTHDSVYALAQAAINGGKSLTGLVRSLASDDLVPYDEAYRGVSAWKILPAIDHPIDAARCIVSGTGLTHLGSARDRSEMHTLATEQLTDSMKMFRWGLERGRPAIGEIGVAPEWFYKGTGAVLRAHGEPLEVPAFGEDGGEEAEVATLYVTSRDGTPFRVGFAVGNEFSDHVFEKKNYLNLAGSKIRTCSIGPEIVIAPTFDRVPGRVRIERATQTVWEREIATGENEMCHSLRNIEHHHFKFPLHQQPHAVHVHFLGAPSLSFGAGVRLEAGDIMEVTFEGFGRPLRNPLHLEKTSPSPVVPRVLS